jgi:hypothetical protein
MGQGAGSRSGVGRHRQHRDLAEFGHTIISGVVMQKHAAAIVLVSVVAGCSGDNVTGLTANASTITATSATIRAAAATHVSGSCETTPVAPPVVVFPILRQEDTGICQLSHLGRTVLHAFRVVNLANGTQVAQITYTAANGDVLRTTAVGTSSPPGPTSFLFTGTTTIVGGTGRFANATGALQAEGEVNLITATALISYDGWIAYDASDRSN